MLDAQSIKSGEGAPERGFDLATLEIHFHREPMGPAVP